MAKTASFWSRHGCLGCFGLFMALFVAGYVALKVYEHRFEQYLFPARIEVTSTIYRVEENWGFGPGGNETGVIVYGLDEATSKRLQQTGRSLVDDRSIRAAVGGANRDYYEWKQTPIDGSERQWSSNDPSHGSTDSSLILRYLNRYGFGVAVAPSMASEIDDTLSNTGAYYAYGRGGSLIVIAPKKRQLIFAYAG